MEPSLVDDTHPSVRAFLTDWYRKMPPELKLQRVRELTIALEELALADIRRRYPEADARELALRLASRRIQPELMFQAFGWDVRTAGY